VQYERADGNAYDEALTALAGDIREQGPYHSVVLHGEII